MATSHQSWTVSKLHSDLVSLRKHLAKHFPTLQIPPLSTTAMPTVTGGGTGSRRGSGSGRSGSGSGSGSGGSGNVGGGANAGVGGGSGHAASNTKHKIPGAMIRAFLAYIVAHSMILHSRAVNEFFEGKESDRAAGWSSRPCLRHEFFAQVDYARQQVLTQPEHQVVVKQRNRHICPIEVREPKSMIIWEFRTQKFDIAFSIVRVRAAWRVGSCVRLETPRTSPACAAALFLCLLPLHVCMRSRIVMWSDCFGHLSIVCCLGSALCGQRCSRRRTALVIQLYLWRQLSCRTRAKRLSARQS